MRFLGALAIAFIVLKLVGIIAWPWALVLLPLWFPLAAVCLVVLTYVVCAAAFTACGLAIAYVSMLYAERQQRRRRARGGV